MKKFSTYLAEEKNVHMEHIEDLILNGGVDGTRQAINFLQALRDMMAGKISKPINATVKWDGAPAIFAGVDPSDGKFFVAKKGVFNVQPLLYKTKSEIRSAKELSPDLKRKFAIALSEFSKLGITDVIQGDLLFTKGDLKRAKIDGDDYITFHPNTIVYALPVGSEIAKKILKAKIGVIWHTKYKGDRLADMKADFTTDIVRPLKKSASVFMDNATYRDVSGVATFTDTETATLTEILSKAGKIFRGVDADTLNAIADNEDLKMRIKAFVNSRIREGESITSPRAFVRDLVNYLLEYYDAQIESKKTERGKAPAREKKKDMLKVSTQVNALVDIFTIYKHIQDAKSMIISKMDKTKAIPTFLKTKDGYKVTEQEGYVAIDHVGDAIKLVDRMQFSYANFSPEVVKGWQR